MSPELLTIVKDIRQGNVSTDPEIPAPTLFSGDAFACGCVIGVLCSRGTHPFQHAASRNIADNILRYKRVNVSRMGIASKDHVELVDKLTAQRPVERWSLSKAKRLSKAFTHGGTMSSNNSSTLLDSIYLREQPPGSCFDQLLSPQIVAECPIVAEIIGMAEARVEKLLQSRLPTTLDVDS